MSDDSNLVSIDTLGARCRRAIALVTMVLGACSWTTPAPATGQLPAPLSGARVRQPAAVDLSGAWATGSSFEPTVRQVTLHLECNYTPPFWVLEQSGDTVRAFTNPESRAQGIRAPDVARPIPAEGVLSGVDVVLEASGTRYVLHYDSTSGHLRGTLNGAPFWAVREELVRAANCIPVP